jgi:thiamine biosynthesis lipoprotein
MLFSLGGAGLSIACMALLKRSGVFGLIGVSIGGAAAHNAGQLLVAALMIDNVNVFVYLPVLMLAACAGGALIGIISHILIVRLRGAGLGKGRIPIIFLVLTSMIAVSVSGGCAAPRADDDAPAVRTRLLLDTVCTVSVYTVTREASGDDGAMSDKEALAEGALDLCEKYDALFDAREPGSDLYRITHAGGERVEVDPDVGEVIANGMEYGRLTDGMFDILIGPLTALWDFSSATAEREELGADSASERKPPEADAIANALPHAAFDPEGVSLWRANEESPDAVQSEPITGVKLTDARAAVELGGLAKGSIADKMCAYLKENGATGAIVDLGGSISLVGAKPDAEFWSVGVENPETSGVYRKDEDAENAEQSAADPLVGKLRLKGGQSAVTAGVYQRGFACEGRYYHHILNPHTGFPSDTDLLSATVVANSAGEGDFASTTCILYGSEAALRFLKEQGYEGVLTKENGVVLTTPGIKLYE